MILKSQQNGIELVTRSALASDSLVRDVIYDDWGAGYVFITVTSDTAIKLAKGSLVAVGQQRHKKPFAVTRFPVVSKKKYE